MTKTSFTASSLSLSGDPIYKGPYLTDQGSPFASVQLVEFQLMIRCPPTAKLVMAFIWGASHQHYPVGTLLKGLENKARTHLP
jgi:hypothetical protein